MLWKKGWWETRWLFLIGLAAILLVFALIFTVDYDAAKWSAKLRHSEGLSESERNILASFQGRTWALWFKSLLNFLWTDYAVIMGAVCLFTFSPWIPQQGAAGLFTLSLPVSRRKVLLWQALVGFSEIFLVALVVPLLLPLIARLQGQWFPWKDALVYALTMVLGGAVFFCFSFLLSVILGNFFAAFCSGGSGRHSAFPVTPILRCAPLVEHTGSGGGRKLLFSRADSLARSHDQPDSLGVLYFRRHS